MVEEVADLVNHGEFWVSAKTTEAKTERLACAIVPLVGAGLGRGARQDDRQARQHAVAVDRVDSCQRAPHRIERRAGWDLNAAADRNAQQPAG